MADSNEDATLECSICNEVLVDPRALQCGHSYCGQPRFCLNSLEDPIGTITCAICRVEHKITASDVRPLYGIREFLLGHTSSGVGSSNRSGSVCMAHSDMISKFWCTRCDTSICERCLDESHDSHSVRNLARHLEEQCRMKEERDFPGGLPAYSERAREYIEQIDIELQLVRDRLSELEKARTVVVEKKEIVDHFTMSRANLKTDNVHKFINLTPELPVFAINVISDASSSIIAERISKIGNPQTVNLKLFIKRGEPIATEQHNPLNIFGKPIKISSQFRSAKNNSRIVAIRFSKNSFKSKILADERAVLAISFHTEDSRSSKVLNFKPQTWSMKDNVKEINTLSTDEILNPLNYWLKSDNLRVTIFVFTCTVSNLTLSPQNQQQ